MKRFYYLLAALFLFTAKLATAQVNYSFSATTSTNTSQPPDIAWQKSLGGSVYEGNSDWGFNIKQTSDGGYILAGTSGSNDGDVSGNHGGADYWIVKLNSSGIIEWEKCLGGSSYDAVFSIEQTSDGGYIAAGHTQSNDGDVSGNHDATGATVDCWIVKLNGNGGIEWQKCFGGTIDDGAFSVKQTSDGGYVFAGVAYSNDGDVSGNHSANGDFWIVKLNSAGTLQWQKCFGGSAVDGAFATGDDWALSINQTFDGGFIAAGYTTSNDGDVSGYHGTYPPDYWIVKLDANGTLQWQKCLGGSEADKAASVEQTTDGGYIIMGTASSNDGDLAGGNSADYNSDYWVVKLNSIGALQWQKRFGGSGPETGSSIRQTTDGGYILAGDAASRDGDVYGNHGDWDYWIVKLTSDGGFQWQKCLGGFRSDNARSIGTTTDGGYIIAGISNSTDGDVTGNHGDYDFWVVKLSPDVMLPVTLLDFSGKINGEQNLLYWTTATEINTAGFEVQRSNDGTNFNKIRFVNTKSINGNSNSNLKYDFIDDTYSSTTNYYRLKQIDKDGRFSYSNIVMLKNNNALTAGISVYPNPSKNILNVKVVSHGDNKITLLIRDLSGKLLMNKVAEVVEGGNIVKIDIAALHAGTYFLKVVLPGGRENGEKKFVKE